MIIKSTRLVLAAALAWCAAAGSASAGDQNGNFMVRLQGTYLAPQDSTRSLVTAGGIDLKAAGFSTELTNEILPTATLTYFFNQNIAAELFCCFGKIQANALAGGVKLGEAVDTWMFPPILTLQYHFTGMGAFKPYVGAGVQWIKYFSTDTGANILGADRVRLSDSFGPALQIGFDYHMGNGWYLNADVKKSWLDTKATFTNSAFAGDDVILKHRVDPLTVSFGVGYRFNTDSLFGRGSPMK